MTRSDLYQALRSATEGEFDLLGELDADAGWMAYLAQAPSGALAILLLHRTSAGEEFDLQTVDALDGSLLVGKTHCPACGAAADGWPRFCGACRRDLSGIAADAAVPGDSAEELLQSVREASHGVYEVLGAMRHTEGGGAMYFAREVDGGRIAGLVLERDGADLSLVRSWGADEEALARPFAAAVPAPADPPPSNAPVSPYVPPAPVPAVAAVAPAVPDDLPPAWTDEPPPRRRRRTPHPLLYAAGGGLVVAAAGAAVLALTRGEPPAVPPASVVDSLRVAAAAAVPPAPVPAWILTDSARPAPADTPRAATPAPAASPPRRRPERPPPQAAPVQPAPAEPTPATPSPEADRQAVMEAVARYASAVQSRDMDRVRAAYPGISGEDVQRWDTWFRRFGPRTELRVTHAISQGPEVNGDEAMVVFTLLMRYQGQRHSVTSRATLRRAGDGWALQALQAPE